jgi:MYXO-CTERM domain-containing protein
LPQGEGVKYNPQRFDRNFTLTILRSNFPRAFCATAFVAWASCAGAATAIDTLGLAPAADSAPSSLSPDAQPYRSLFPAEGEDLSAFIARSSASAVSAAPETSTALKALLGLAGLALLLRRRSGWLKAAYLRFNQRNNPLWRRG